MLSLPIWISLPSCWLSRQQKRTVELERLSAADQPFSNNNYNHGMSLYCCSNGTLENRFPFQLKTSWATIYQRKGFRVGAPATP